MPSAAYKFANQVLPLALAEQAMAANPVAPAKPSIPEPAPVPLPQQGPTATTAPAIDPPRTLQEHDATAQQNKAASFEAQLVQLVVQKQASWAQAPAQLFNLGRGIVGGVAPIAGSAIGSLAGGAAGAVRGIGGAVARGGLPAVLGVGLGLYGASKVMQSPIKVDRTGIRVQSPIHIPNMRFRSPIHESGGGYRLRNPVKVLW